jgi:hypothetical protein
MPAWIIVAGIIVAWFSVACCSVPLVAEEPSLSVDTLGHVDQASADEFPVNDYDRNHWAFQPVAPPEVPQVRDRGWPRTSIDQFVLARLESEGLRPAPPADRETLLRRLSFDLTGLPPSAEVRDAFLRDASPVAFVRLVDALLSSPQFGRRWGQYWLDLARFAETDGFEHDKIRPTAWKYRDWVIESLNHDLPYDRFVALQLAGDVLEPDDPQAVVATAFCLSGPDMPDINSQEERKHVLMNEVTSTISSVLLSLQMGCAQCHDHKYDAISQADFYRLRAFFEPAVKLKLNESVTVLGARRDDDALARMYHRGDWRNPGPLVKAAFPRIANFAQTPVLADQPNDKRVELARWLADRSNPLVARSIVNRIWQHHFGRGLSTTPSDFGLMGDEPSHPELLDYLAWQLMQGDWSLKRLHREIVLSSVYRMRSHSPLEGAARQEWKRSLEQDPENNWLSRFPRRRLDAESIRDAMLAAGESLNHEGGGPGVRPPLPVELVKTLKKGQWNTSDREADHYRRSIYIFARRNLRYPLFATFDRPTADCSCAVRHPSTTALQSLLLLNSEFSLNAATRLAELIDREGNDLDSKCVTLYRRVLSRKPDDEELRLCVDFLRDQTVRLREEGNENADFAALVDLSLALLNSNQFLYVD